MRTRLNFQQIILVMILLRLMWISVLYEPEISAKNRILLESRYLILYNRYFLLMFLIWEIFISQATFKPTTCADGKDVSKNSGLLIFNIGHVDDLKLSGKCQCLL